MGIEPTSHKIKSLALYRTELTGLFLYKREIFNILPFLVVISIAASIAILILILIHRIVLAISFPRLYP